jgi:secretion/DNA translocation related TadE-like protein
MSDVRSQRGQATVLTVVFVTALLGMSALVLDIGSWFRAQRDAQSAADAAALAAAQVLPDEPGTAAGLAASYAEKNGGGSAEVTFLRDDTVKVTVRREAPGFFAKVFGVDSVDVDASATARASGLDAAKYVAPIVVNIKHPQLNCGSSGGRPLPCFGEAAELQLEHLHKPGSGDAAGSFALINLDSDDSGSVGGSLLGDWIEDGFDQYMHIGRYTAVPSAQFNDSHVKDALAKRLHDVLLFPIYKTITGSGSGAEYDVVGWVAFRVSSFEATGSSGKVRGSFEEVIWEGIAASGGSGAGTNFGVRTVELVE